MSAEADSFLLLARDRLCVFGLLATGYQAATRRPASFRLLQRGPDPATFAAVPFLAFAAPFIIMRNILRGRRIEGWRFRIVMIATIVAGSVAFSSFPSRRRSSSRTRTSRSCCAAAPRRWPRPCRCCCPSRTASRIASGCPLHLWRPHRRRAAVLGARGQPGGQPARLARHPGRDLRTADRPRVRSGVRRGQRGRGRPAGDGAPGQARPPPDRHRHRTARHARRPGSAEGLQGGPRGGRSAARSEARRAR